MRFSLVIPLCLRSSRNTLPSKLDGTLPPRSPSSLKNFWESKRSAAAAAATMRKPAIPAVMSPLGILVMGTLPVFAPLARKHRPHNAEFRSDQTDDESHGK